MAADLFLKGSAVISTDGLYRYRLTRTWEEALPKVVWVMMNPSTADGMQDDPTIRRCMRFARHWGAGAIEVVNLFAARCTDPRKLRQFGDPVGPENDQHIIAAAQGNFRLFAAWGAHAACEGRAREVFVTLHNLGVRVECLGLTRDGSPKHPLYVRADTKPIPFTK